MSVKNHQIQATIRVDIARGAISQPVLTNSVSTHTTQYTLAHEHLHSYTKHKHNTVEMSLTFVLNNKPQEQKQAPCQN